MKYISAQPDSLYFLWQLKVQVSNFRALGIEKDYIIVVGHKGKVKREFEEFSDQTEASVVFIRDKREDLSYISTIRPHILKYVDIWGDYDTLYIDSDIILNRNLNLSGSKVLLSDTDSYLSAKYIKSKSNALFEKMCAIVGIDPKKVEEKEKQSGGAQYYFPKGKIDLSFWLKVEIDSLRLFQLMHVTKTVYSPNNPIQAWTADMWAILWNLWLLDVETEISSELDFCWPMDPIGKLKDKPIFHLAGVTEKEKNTHFFKGEYIDKSPFGCKLNMVEGLCYNRYIEQIRVAEKMFS